MDYFDRTYFDPLYFDTDSAASAGGGATSGGHRVVFIDQPDEPERDFSAEIALLL